MEDKAELLRPLSARSVVLSLLLGARQANASAQAAVAIGELFGIAPATMRTALARMVAAGDLVLVESTYALAGRHRERHTALAALADPRQRPYSGTWRMGVVVNRGRSFARRTALRTVMTRCRFAELREGVWLRPDNLEDLLAAARAQAGTFDTDLSELESFTTVPVDDLGLCHTLWDLDAWAARARWILTEFGRRDTVPPIRTLTVAAAAVRHLCTDPALPQELAPEHWPADELRWAYEDYRNHLNTTSASLDTQRAAMSR